MTLGTEETTEIVARTLEGQAAEAQKAADAASERSHQHQGARDVIKVIEANLKAITPAAEAEIMADESLDDETKIVALKHVARSMMRVAHSMNEAHKNQHQMAFLTMGEAKAMNQAAEQMRKAAGVRRAVDRGRAESVAMGEVNKAAKAQAKPKRKRAVKKKALAVKAKAKKKD